MATTEYAQAQTSHPVPTSRSAWPHNSTGQSASLSSWTLRVRIPLGSHREFGSRDSLNPPSRTCFVTCGTGRPKRPHSLVAKAADAAVSSTAAFTGVWVRIPPGLRPREDDRPIPKAEVGSRTRIAQAPGGICAGRPRELAQAAGSASGHRGVSGYGTPWPVCCRRRWLDRQSGGLQNRRRGFESSSSCRTVAQQVERRVRSWSRAGGNARWMTGSRSPGGAGSIPAGPTRRAILRSSVDRAPASYAGRRRFESCRGSAKPRRPDGQLVCGAFFYAAWTCWTACRAMTSSCPGRPSEQAVRSGKQYLPLTGSPAGVAPVRAAFSRGTSTA